MLKRLLGHVNGLLLALAMTSPAVAQQVASERSPLSLRCEMICSPTKLRTGVAVLAWQESRLKAAALSETHIDAAVSKEGFDRNIFVSFPGATPGQKATMSEETAKVLGAVQGMRMRALDLVLLSPVHPQTTGDLVAQLAASLLESGETGVMIANVEPGVNYFWRLRFSAEGRSLVSEAVQCQARICPADLVEGEKQ